ncbi:MAG: precorrin-6y C5,15-methyltransferase (decarboxylating) subunit CbiE [Desulfobulbaceae bacterium]|nr:precorrin-6y C5,15-methyltransferase (decarboxylating) subunit CbiE [Desulfobulbaceae bacterium]
MPSLFIIGVAEESLATDVAAVVAKCGLVVAAQRHKRLVPQGAAGRFVAISPIDEAMDAVGKGLAETDVAVLASGDPFFFGIARMLSEKFGREKITVYPALSSMQLAFSRFHLSWDDACFISLHGRQPDLAALMAGHKVCILTDKTNTPGAIARLLLDVFHGVDDFEVEKSIQVKVGENLGLPEERCVRGSLAEIAQMSFAPLNVMIMLRAPLEKNSVFGLQESEIAHSRGLITKNEVRAATLHALSLPVKGVLWDVGAGSGSVSIEAARLSPGLNIFAVERNKPEVANIKKNVRQFQTYTVRVVSGLAPDVLEKLPDPDRVFVGGSGGQLDKILQTAAKRLRPGGKIVVNGVLEKTVTEAPEFLRRNGCSVQISEVSVKRRSYPGTINAQEYNPISIITGWK